MKNQAAGKSQALAARSEGDRDLAKKAMAVGPWDVRYLAHKYEHQRYVVTATRETLSAQLTTTLNHHEPKLDGSLSAQVKAHLHTIGAAVRPDFTPTQADAWVHALMIKLSDLPPHIAIKATARALHVPFEFPGQVEVKVRELADEHLERQRQACARLREVEQAIHDALHPKPRLAGPEPVADGEHVIPTELAHHLQRNDGLCRGVWNLGRALGYVTDDQVLPELEGDEPPAIDLTQEHTRKEPSNAF